MPQAWTLAPTRSGPSPRAALGFLALASTLWAWDVRAQEADSGAAAGTQPEADGGAVAAASTAGEPAAEGDTIVSHGYSFFGDLKYPADFDHLDYVNPEAPKGGEISQWAQGNFDSFNMYTIQGNATAWGAFQFESLMTGTADEATASYCLICNTLEYPASLGWVIFTMRTEAAFSDGSPLTAHDVKFSYDLFMEQGLESYRMAAGGFVTAVEVLDEHRIKFTFAPDAPARDRIPFAGGISILSQAEFERTSARLDAPSDTPFLGSGPYLIDNWDIGRRIMLRRDEDYWGDDLPINVGRNNFDTIRVEYFADATVALEAFKAGEYTFRNETDPLLWATAYDFPAVQSGQVVREEIPDGGIPLAAYWVYNLRRELFQDIRVREALALMFNFEWTNETLLYDLYEPLPSFFTNTEMMAEGLPTEGELAILQPLVDEGLLDGSILTAEAVVPPVSSAERAMDRGNLRQASALLDEAGWTVGTDGLRRNADGEVLSVEFLEFSPTFERLTLPYIENLKRLGVDARFSIVDSAQFTQRRDSSDFDISRWSPGMGFEPGSGLKQWFGSESAAESNRNLVGLQDPAVDRIIDIVINAETRDEMHTAARALDRVLRAMRLGVPRWYNPNIWVAYYDMYDHPEPLPPFGVGELDFWWYNAEAASELQAAGALQ
jgi:microcin C transport system substrate-binding protein